MTEETNTPSAAIVLSEIFTGELPNQHYREVLRSMKKYASLQTKALQEEIARLNKEMEGWENWDKVGTVAGPIKALKSKKLKV